MTRTWQRWTKVQDTLLWKHWGMEPRERTAKRTGHSVFSCRGRLRSLRGTSSSQGGVGLFELARLTGYGHTMIHRARKELDIRVRTNGQRRWALNEDQVDRIIDYLANGPDAIRESHRCVGWSRAHKKCRFCGETDRPHAGGGYCTRCIQKVVKIPWAQDRDKCRGCDTMERPHKADGLCARCYMRRYNDRRRA